MEAQSSPPLKRPVLTWLALLGALAVIHAMQGWTGVFMGWAITGYTLSPPTYSQLTQARPDFIGKSVTKLQALLIQTVLPSLNLSPDQNQAGSGQVTGPCWPDSWAPLQLQMNDSLVKWNSEANLPIKKFELPKNECWGPHRRLPSNSS